MHLPHMIRSLKPRRVLHIYSGLPRETYALFAANVVNGLGVFVMPFLTMLLTIRIGLSPIEAGSVILAASIALVPGTMAGGKLVDTVGRKPVLVTASLLSAAFFVPCAFLGRSPLIIGFIIAAEFFGGAVRPAVTALVSDITLPAQRQAAFSLLYLGHNIGFAVGPLVAGFLFNRHAGLLFLGDAITTFAAMVLVLLLVPDTRPGQEEMAASGRLNPGERPEVGGIIGVLSRRPYLVAFVLIVTVLNLVYAQIGFTLPLQLTGIFRSDGPAAYGLLMTVNGIVVITLTAPVVSLTRRNRPVFNMALTGAIYAVGFGMIRFVGTLPLLVISTVIWSVGEVVGATNIDAYIANHTPASHRGRMNSFTPLFLRLGFSLSPLLMGLYVQHFPIRSVWILSAGVAASAAGALVIMGTMERRRAVSAPE